MDPDDVPDEVEALAREGGQISAGDMVGRIYDAAEIGIEPHLHINVISSEGIYENLLNRFPALGDETPPRIENGWWARSGGDGTYIGVGPHGALEDMDFQALEATVTPDFELVEDTLVMDLSGFVEFLRPFEAAEATISYQFSDFNTEVQGPVAWTRYRNRAVLEVNGEGTRYQWLERAVLTRGADGWRIDRLQSAPVRIEPDGS